MIRFYFDIVCPYAWIASQRLAWLAEATGRSIEHCPVLLGGVLREVGSPDRPMDAMAPVKQRYTVEDVRRQGARYGLDIRYPDGHPRRTVEAMRLLTAAPAERVAALAQELWRAYWTDGADLTDRDVLRGIAERHGVELARIDDPAIKAELRARTEAAVAEGVFGVPSFVCDGTLVWGGDRMDSFAHSLGADVVPELPRGPLEVFHDFSSPYSFLGVMTLLNAGVEVTLRPMLLGALFKTIGTPIVPIATFSRAKQRYAQRDMLDQAAYRGLPLVFTPHFPLHTVTALRVAIAEPETTAPLYRAAWVEGVDLGDRDALRGFLDEAGFDGAALIERTAEPAIKAELRANTERAVELGVPGAPSFLSNGRIFWGQDRLPLVAHLEETPC